MIEVADLGLSHLRRSRYEQGGQTPFAGGKGTVMEGGFRAPAIIRWPGEVPAGKVENGVISGAAVKPDIPILVNLRLDPFERTGFTGSVEYFQWFKYEFWRFVYVPQQVAKLARTAIEFPPMQKGARFNLEAVKEQVPKAVQSHASK